MNSAGVIELRQYLLHPGQRETLVEIFDREFVEGQEVTGCQVLGQFYDLDDPNRFVWLRGFPVPAQRSAVLEAFYGGPVWAANRDAANATMVSWDDVLLLTADTLTTSDSPRPPIGSSVLRKKSLFSIDVHHVSVSLGDRAIQFFRSEMEPQLAAAGGERTALMTTDATPNGFPALPVREGECVIVRITRFEHDAAFAAATERLANSDRWAEAKKQFGKLLVAPSQHLRLRPTERSLLC